AFAANITYPKNDYLRETVKIIPLERILLETDSPFLAPQSRRGQRNEPSAVKEIAELIAELKGISFEEVAAQTTQNAQKIFNI
ncbi:MAG: TatD family hydrolase, partial [Patescibacteria group bacterium]